MSDINKLIKVKSLLDKQLYACKKRLAIIEMQLHEAMRKQNLLQTALLEYQKKAINSSGEGILSLMYKQLNQFTNQLRNAISIQEKVINDLNQKHHTIRDQNVHIQKKMSAIDELIAKIQMANKIHEMKKDAQNNTDLFNQSKWFR